MNSRELAGLIWLLILIVFSLRSHSGRQSIVDLLSTLASWKIWIVWSTVVIWTIAACVLVDAVGLWDRSLGPPTMFWLVTAGVAVPFFSIEMMGGLVWKQLRVRALQLFGFSGLLALFLNVRTFSLWVELILQPVLIVLLLLSLMPAKRREERILKVFWELLLVSLVGLLVWLTARGLAADWDRTDRDQLALSVAHAVWLPLAMIPLQVSLAAVFGYEKAFTLVRALTGRPIPKRTKWTLVCVTRGRFGSAQKFARLHASELANGVKGRDLRRLFAQRN